MKKALTYDDIQLVPEYSDIKSRTEVNLRTKITKDWSIDIPIISAPMDSLTGKEMAIALLDLGGVGCVHRFMSIDEQASIIKNIYDHRDKTKKIHIPIAAAVGANGDYFERSVELIKNGADIILIDVAHGHHENVKNAIEKIKGINQFVNVIAGNICTAKAAIDLQQWGADGLRIGVGGGSLCTTRIKTGFGVPNVTCIKEIVSVSNIPVIADGGIKTSGDIAKALALGATSVMLGSMLSGTDETPGELIDNTKVYRGAASLETKKVNNQSLRNIEGESTMVSYKGSVSDIILDILDGVRSALSYAGSYNIQSFNPEIIEITNAGIKEASPHLLN